LRRALDARCGGERAEEGGDDRGGEVVGSHGPALCERRTMPR
jgi:hypothetical protein